MLATRVIAAAVFVFMAFACVDGGSADPLTDVEQQWLADHGPITVAVPADLAPAAVIDEGGTVTGGWAVELTQLAGLKVGADIELVAYPDIVAAVAAVADGDVDMVAGLGPRPDLLGFAEPLTPLSWTPVVFAAGPDRLDMADTDSLVGRSVTSIPGSPIEGRILQEYTQLEYVHSDTIGDALVRVFDGEVDLWAGPLAITTYQLERQGRGSLRVIGDPLQMIEVSAWGQAGSTPVSILEKGRQRITDTELAVIHVRWTGFDLTDPANRSRPAWLLPLMVGLLGLVAVVGAFALTLRRQVATRTGELATANEDLAHANDTLEDTVAIRTATLQEQSVELGVANDRLLRSNDALAQFSRRVAHDLRTPLVAIRGFSKMASNDSVSDEVRRVSLATIETSAVRAAELIEEILDDARQLVPTAVSPITIAELESWLLDFLAVDAERRGTAITVASTAEQIDLPAGLLKQVLINLVGNAMKHGGSDGLTVSVHLVRSTTTPARWTITVDDDGQGIPPDQRQMVFESGYRSATAGQLGSGLGLAACREAILSHAGSIEALESSLGGTQIRVTLPVIETAAAEISPTSRHSVPAP